MRVSLHSDAGEQMKLHRRSGSIGMEAVHQINGSRPLLCFFVDDAAFFYIVSHVSDMYAYFPQSVFDGADRKCVVEVLGVFRVDGESRYLTEVFASGYLFRSNFCGDLISAVSTAFGYT